MKLVLLLLCAAARASATCIASITTATGHKAPSRICSGDLIFNEEFNSFDFQTWNHEKTATGGGVSISESDLTCSRTWYIYAFHRADFQHPTSRNPWVVLLKKKVTFVLLKQNQNSMFPKLYFLQLCTF